MTDIKVFKYKSTGNDGLLFSDRINELIQSGKVRVMTWEQYRRWKEAKAR